MEVRQPDVVYVFRRLLGLIILVVSHLTKQMTSIIICFIACTNLELKNRFKICFFYKLSIPIRDVRQIKFVKPKGNKTIFYIGSHSPLHMLKCCLSYYLASMVCVVSISGSSEDVERRVCGGR